MWLGLLIERVLRLHVDDDAGFELCHGHWASSAIGGIPEQVPGPLPRGGFGVHAVAVNDGVVHRCSGYHEPVAVDGCRDSVPIEVGRVLTCEVTGDLKITPGTSEQLPDLLVLVEVRQDRRVGSVATWSGCLLDRCCIPGDRRRVSSSLHSYRGIGHEEVVGDP